MKRTFILLLFIPFTSFMYAQSSVEPVSFEEDILLFFELSGVSSSIENSLKDNYDYLNDEIQKVSNTSSLTGLKNSESEDVNSILNSLVPFYKKYFTHEEIKKIIQHYQYNKKFDPDKNELFIPPNPLMTEG